MKIKKHFLIGFVTGCLSIILLAAGLIFLLPGDSSIQELTNQMIVLKEGEKLLFTYDNYSVNEDELDVPLFTYIKKNGKWLSHHIPEGFMTKTDEYILTTSKDKLNIFLLLPVKNKGYVWNLPENRFERLNEISEIKPSKLYLHANR